MAAQPSRPNESKLALLRKLALREAARRQQEASSSPRRTDRDVESGGSPSRYRERDASQLDASQLEGVLEEERRKNDVEELRLQKQREAICSSEVPSAAPSGPLQEKKRELARLDFEVQNVEANLGTLQEPYSDAILALLTRSAVASSIEQYEEALKELHENAIDEQKCLDEEQALFESLLDVQKGLERRRETVARQSREKVNFHALKGKLEKKVEETEAELITFLQSVIRISSMTFSDKDVSHRAQLRHLIDTLINKAWDTPMDPYVDTENDYQDSIVALVLRANIATEHPRDARKIRLIDFGRRSA